MAEYERKTREELLNRSELVVGNLYSEFLSNCVVELEELINGGLARCRVVELPAATPGNTRYKDDIIITPRQHLKPVK